MRHLFVSSPFYTLIFPLIANRSSISQQLHFNLCYFYFGILSSLLMTFMSHFDQLQLYPCSSTTLWVHKFTISQFHPEQQLPQYYNDTWCTYVPLRLHVSYTLSGGGVTILLYKIIFTKVIYFTTRATPHLKCTCNGTHTSNHIPHRKCNPISNISCHA